MTFKARGLYASSSKEPRRSRVGLWLFLGGLLALALVAATVLSVLGNVAVTREQASQTYDAGARVQIDNRTNGSVRIVPADVEQVQLERTLSTSPLRGVDESVTESGDSLQVEAGCTGPGLFLTTCSADYEITVPTETDLELTTVSGPVEASGLQGQLGASTTSGDITVSDHQGQVRAEAVSGRVELADVQGSVEAETTSGHISATGEGERARAETTSGGVDLSGYAGQEVEADSTSGDVTVGDFTGADLSSVSGDVEINSGQELQTLTVETTSGSVRAQVPQGRYDVSGDSTSGDREIGVDTSPDADAQIRIDTVSGSVHLSRS
ncbi:DUF4097 family beta strand repeat-containing protein [Nocardiopsis salina]|uniref:DUF4097 family beta strand repeat-containing protein n=1 Tax=Nocardiopsis salina TaxID=245836 RepID=UPI0003499EDF|nr:DUF4097 family beta strand repeat-containing protein [Nocardiopsis salina]